MPVPSPSPAGPRRGLRGQQRCAIPSTRDASASAPRNRPPPSPSKRRHDRLRDTPLAVPFSDGIKQGSCVTNNSTAAPVDWPLIDPESVPDDIEKGSWATADSATHGGRSVAAIASADTSRLCKVKLSFQSWGGALILDTGCLTMPDPWSVRPIKFLPEVLCNHQQLVLLRLCSTCSNSSRDFFVYSFPYLGKDATAHKIPNVLPDILASQSFGLLRDKKNCNKYVIANLQMLNPKIGYVEACLHRWWPSSESWLSSPLESVTLHSDIDMRKWQTDQVIPCPEGLLWVDLRQGILFRFKNPLQKKAAKFDIIYLPHKKSVRRPETFVSLGCCNGKLKFVSLNIRDVSVGVTIMTFNESSYKSSYRKRPVQYWDRTSRFSLKCTELWAAMKIMLLDSPALLPSDWEMSDNHMPCFPVLNADKDILYLTMARKDKKRAWLLQVDTEAIKDNKGTGPRKDNKGAWLLQADTESDTSMEFDTESNTESDTSMESMEYRALVGVIDYPGFCLHQKPPYSCHCL